MRIILGENRLYAELNISNQDIDDITEEKILEFLDSSGIRQGYLNSGIQSLLAGVSGTFIKVAEGVAPIHGEDTQFKILFKNELKADKPRPLTDGSVDHRDLGYVIPVRKGDKLIEIIPPTVGSEGVDVYGNPIFPEPGKEIALILGLNTSISSDGLAVIAEEDGVASFSNMEVKVERTLLINCDIDYAIGNLFFPGDITICGSVIDGFKVISEGNIFIHKDVVNATVETRGSIVINGTINNKSGGYVKAGENIEANSVQFGNLTAGNRISVLTEVRYSNLTANHQIIVDQEKSYIIGGKINCYGKVTVYDLGSKVEASKLTVSFSENVKMLKRLKDILEIIAENIDEIKQIDLEIKNIEQYLASPNMSSEEFPEFEKIFEEFLQRKANMEKRNKELAEEKIVINQNLREKDKPMLIVKNAVYPGVILEFPTSRFEITTEKRQVMIFEDFKIIKFRPL